MASPMFDTSSLDLSTIGQQTPPAAAETAEVPSGRTWADDRVAEWGKPREQVIQSKILEARTKRQAAESQYDTDHNIKLIQRDLTETEEQMKRRDAELSRIAEEFRKPLPNMPETLDVSPGMGLGAMLMQLAGGDADIVANALAKQTLGANQIAFENAMRQASNQRGAAELDYNREYDRMKALMDDRRFLQGSLMQQRDTAAQWLMRLQEQESARDFDREMFGLQDAAATRREERGYQFQREMSDLGWEREKWMTDHQAQISKDLATFNQTLAKEMEDIRQKYGERSGVLDLAFKGLFANTDEGAVQAMVDGIKADYGIALPAGTVDLFKSVAREAKSNGDFQRWLQRQNVSMGWAGVANDARRTTYAGYGAGLVQDPISGELVPPANPFGPGMGVSGSFSGDPVNDFGVWRGQMPALKGAAMTDFEQLLSMITEYDTLNDQYTMEAAKNLGGVIGGAAGFSRGVPPDVQKAQGERKAKLDLLKAQIADKRTTLNAQVRGTDFEAWRNRVWEFTAARLKEVRSDSNLTPEQKKAKEAELKRQYRRTTGDNK